MFTPTWQLSAKGKSSLVTKLSLLPGYFDADDNSDDDEEDDDDDGDADADGDDDSGEYDYGDDYDWWWFQICSRSPVLSALLRSEMVSIHRWTNMRQICEKCVTNIWNMCDKYLKNVWKICNKYELWWWGHR